VAIELETLKRIQALERMASDLAGALISTYGVLTSLWIATPATIEENSKISERLDELNKSIRKVLDEHSKLGRSDG
jgi:flagellar motor component MotA